MTFDLEQSPPVARRLWALGFGARGRTFRGGVLGTIADAPMGKGHGNDNKPFDPDTACYTQPIYASIDNPHKRKVVISSGVKTLKSFIVEAAAVDHLCNKVGDVGIFFGTAESADDVSSTRILDYFEGVPLYQEKMKTIAGQWDYTMGAVKFPDKTLWIKPANLANAQQKNLCFVGIQDAFVCGKNGMIDQLIERTTQYPNEKKIVIESQGGEVGFDFDRHFADSNQGELHVLCPDCGSKHVFNWRAWDMVRGEDFQAVLPLSQKSGVRSQESEAAEEAARGALTEELKSENRKRCGFKRGPEELIKLPDGEYNEAAVLRETYYECFYCGSAWRDTPETREKLDRSVLTAGYVPANPSALPSVDGFSVAQWINRRLPWGDMMLKKLKAQRIAKETGNLEPLKQWWQKIAGRTWDPDIARVVDRKIAPGSTYDPERVRELFGENFHSVNMSVDCQEDADHKAQTGKSITGWFWYVVRAFDKTGNSKQLARGYCKSWDEWRAVQKHWGVPNDRLIIDIVQWSEQVMAKAVEYRETVKLDKPHPIFKTMEKTVLWKLLAASPGRQNFKGHRDGVVRPWSPEVPVYGNMIDEHGKVKRVPIMRIQFNKTPIQLQVDALYSGAPGLPKFEYLKREQLRCPDGNGGLRVDMLTQDMETGMRTYENQMSSQYYEEATNKYVELRPDDHYYWCEQALQVRVGMDGLLGHSAVFE